MDLITFNQEQHREIEEEMSIRRCYSIFPSQSLDPLYYKAKVHYQLPSEEVLVFSTYYLN